MLLWESFHQKENQNSLKVSTYVQSWPDPPGQYTDSWSCTVHTTGPHEPFAFLIGWLVLHWGNTHAIMCKCIKLTNARTKSANYSSLQAEQLLGHVSDSLGNTK